MNTRQFKNILARTMQFMVIVAMVFSVAGSAYAQEPIPWLIAFPENDAVEVWEWPVGETVILSISGSEWTGVAEVKGDGDERTYVRFELGGEFDLQVDHEVILLTNDSVEITSHTVQNLSVTEVNGSEDIVSGTAEADAIVQVWPHGYDDLMLTLPVLEGNWVANFGESGFHSIEETGGKSWVVVEGNATAVDWNYKNPHFTVFPEWEWFDGLDWPEGALVLISVEGKPECHLERNSWGGFFNGNFPEGCNIEPGDSVTFSDGDTDRFHQVWNLYVTYVDTSENTVAGKASAGETIFVWPHDGWFDPLQTNADESGVWEVDLDDVGYDIQDDSAGRSEIRDEWGNATASDWHVTHPRFTVFPEWDWFDGLDWPNYSEIDITVDDKPECNTKKESMGYFFNGSFGEGCDLEIGDEVTFTDENITRVHTVQNLAVTKSNQYDDTIKGIADLGAEVYVWPHATGEQKLAITKKTGDWVADFSEIYDLTPGECGRSEIRDEDANSTAVDWCISNPRIIASESGDWFWTSEYKPGDIYISIYDSSNEGANLLWSGEQVADESGFALVGSDIHGLDLVPGNFLVVSDGDSQKSLVLKPISVTMFDTRVASESMAGTAPAGSMVYVTAGMAEPETQATRVVTTDVDGFWSADFSDDEHDITIFMQPWSFAQILDEDGDANEGSVPPLWAASFTSENRTWEVGNHNYQFYSHDDPITEGPVTFTVSEEAPNYAGYVLLRPWGMRICGDDGSLQNIGEIRPDQATRFNTGYVTEYTMTSEEAEAFFNSMDVWVSWDVPEMVQLVPSEIIPYSYGDWQAYLCGLTIIE